MEVSEISSKPVWAVFLLLKLFVCNERLKIKTFATFELQKQKPSPSQNKFSLKISNFFVGKAKSK